MERITRKAHGSLAEVKPNLIYSVLPMNKVQVRKTGKNKLLDCEVRIRDEWYATSPRFWTSVFAKFGFASSIFRYFQPQEVFDRIAYAKPDTELRFCVDKTTNRALATSTPKRVVINTSDLATVLSKYNSHDVSYYDGVVSTMHQPPSGEAVVKIGPDDFRYAYALETPLDGYGEPNIYLSMLRIVCYNGMVGYSRAFRSSIKIGDDPIFNIGRTLDSFDSDEGYNALRARLDMAQKSPASLHECRQLFRLIQRLESPSEVEKGYQKAVGDLNGEYGVTSLDAISDKKLKLLPSKHAKVYDLLNVASEASSHYLEGREQGTFQAYVGTVLSEEFDLEGAMDSKVKEFTDIFMDGSVQKRTKLKN